MKKLLLTVCTAALFSLAAIGQERDSVRTESNQFRENVEESAEDASQNIEEGAQNIERETEEAGQNIQQESQNFREDVNETGNEIEEGAERTGKDIEQGAERAGDELQEGAERAGDEVEQRTDRMDNERQQDPNMQSETDTLEQMNQQFRSTVDPEQEGNRQGSTNNNAAPELEVVEGKEGPDNEVVYKYQGELFYVDREKKQLVKADESELEEANHEVIVKEGEESSDDENARARK